MLRLSFCDDWSTESFVNLAHLVRESKRLALYGGGILSDGHEPGLSSHPLL